MSWNRAITIIAAFFCFFTAACEEPGITLYYSATLNGNLDGCSCQIHPRAGLVKRAVFLDQLKERSRSILVETGNILSFDTDMDLAANILDVYSELGYDAIGIGNSEFSLGLNVLKEYSEKYPLICHNLTICEDDFTCIIYSPEPVIKEKGEYSIGIISLLDPDYFNYPFMNIMEKAQLLPPKDRAGLFVRKLDQSKVDLKVCLFYGYYKNAKSLIEAVPGIDVLVLGGEEKLIEGEKIINTHLVSPGEEGNRLGILDVHFTADGIKYSSSFKYFTKNDPDLPKVRERIYKYNRELRKRLMPELND
ncbi:MAG: hypothetical protein JW969_03770 [Spirochaetales bacterium]|nr:hypothetical protein [Spirochaetales bacterium]